MRTEERVKEALLHHLMNMKRPEKERREVAKKLKWDFEYLKGYADGVKWVYEWVLEIHD